MSVNDTAEGVVHDIPDHAAAAEISDDEYGQELEPREIKRNMVSLVLLETTFWTGDADIQLALQPLLVFLGATNTMIGLVNGAMFVGLMGIFLTPWITRRFRYKKWYLFVSNVPFLTPLGLMALFVIFHKQIGFEKNTLLYWVLALYMIRWFFGGFVSLPCTEYIAACIPMSHRGRLTGYAYSASGACAIGAALLGKWIIDNYPQPSAFGFVLLIGWFLQQGGYGSALFAKERPTPVEKSPNPWSGDMIRALLNDKLYVRLLILYFIYTALFIPTTFNFINIYGFKQLKMALGTAGVMIIVAQISKFATSAPLGLFIDKLTPKRTIPYLFILSAVAWLVPCVFRGGYGVYISIAIYTIFLTGITSAQTALICGLPSPEHRAGHFTIQIILWYLAWTIGPIVVGRLCDVIHYYPVFIMMAVLSAAFVPFSKFILRPMPDSVKGYH